MRDLVAFLSAGAGAALGVSIDHWVSGAATQPDAGLFLTGLALLVASWAVPR